LILVAGCVDRHLDGAWQGPFPLAGASDCRVRMLVDRSFDLSCQGDEWIGQGRYEMRGDLLTFRFERLSRRGEPTSAREVELRAKREGNVLLLARPDQEHDTYRWERRLARRDP
jgi:hypothetical protein